MDIKSLFFSFILDDEYGYFRLCYLVNKIVLVKPNQTGNQFQTKRYGVHTEIKGHRLNRILTE